MSNKSQSTAIGGFVLGAIVLLVGAIFLFAKNQFGEEVDKAVLFFDESLSGLDVGAPVVINGVKIGQVSGIEVLSDTSKLEIYTPVYIDIYPDTFRQLNDEWDEQEDENQRKIIEKGLRATLQTQSLVTGKMQVALEFRPEVPIKLKGIIKDINEFPTAPNTFTVLTSKLEKLPLQDIAANVNSLVTNINRFVGDANLATTLSQANQTLAEFKKIASTFDKEIKPVANEFKETMDEYQRLARVIEGKVPELTDNLGTAFSSLDTLLKEAEALMGSVERSYGDNSELKYQLNITLQEVSKAAHSLKLLTDYLERHPEALIYGKEQP